MSMHLGNARYSQKRLFRKHAAGCGEPKVIFHLPRRRVGGNGATRGQRRRATVSPMSALTSTDGSPSSPVTCRFLSRGILTLVDVVQGDQGEPLAGVCAEIVVESCGAVAGQNAIADVESGGKQVTGAGQPFDMLAVHDLTQCRVLKGWAGFALGAGWWDERERSSWLDECSAKSTRLFRELRCLFIMSLPSGLCGRCPVCRGPVAWGCHCRWA